MHPTTGLGALSKRETFLFRTITPILFLGLLGYLVQQTSAIFFWPLLVQPTFISTLPNTAKKCKDWWTSENGFLNLPFKRLMTRMGMRPQQLPICWELVKILQKEAFEPEVQIHLSIVLTIHKLCIDVYKNHLMYTSCILFWIIHPTIPSWVRYQKENVLLSCNVIRANWNKKKCWSHTIYIKVLVTLICENVKKKYYYCYIIAKKIKVFREKF